MAQHDIEITISKTGEVKVHIEGVKGKGCLEYAKWLSKIIGKVENQKMTSEYYEPEIKTRINLREQLKTEE